MTDHVIETKGLTVFYGRQRGIVDVNLGVQRGEVFGFLGPNGAGKTTAQRVLMDVIRPTRGCASVFGLDCQRQGTMLRDRIGYLPGELSLYRYMKADAFLRLMASLRHNSVDTAYRDALFERLDLHPTRRIQSYSRGNKQKVGIVAAFMSKPELLILDEPTSGLDPLMQLVVLDLVREARDDGRTVFFSSHNLQEVQSVCDRVGIIRDGRLIETDRVERLTRQQFKRVQIRFNRRPEAGVFSDAGVAETVRDGNSVTLEIRAGLGAVLEKAAVYGIEDIETLPVTLEEIFLTYYETPLEDG